MYVREGSNEASKARGVTSRNQPAPSPDECLPAISALPSPLMVLPSHHASCKCCLGLQAAIFGFSAWAISTWVFRVWPSPSPPGLVPIFEFCWLLRATQVEADSLCTPSHVHDFKLSFYETTSLKMCVLFLDWIYDKNHHINWKLLCLSHLFKCQLHGAWWGGGVCCFKLKCLKDYQIFMCVSVFPA